MYIKRMNVPFKKKTFTTILIIFVIVAAAAVLLGTIGGGKEAASAEAEPEYTPVKIIRAEKGSITRTLRLNGYIQSDDVITVIPFVSGTLEELNVELGDTVKEKQLLARIDSRTYDLQLKQAEAAYLGAKSSFERVEQLYRSSATTKQNYDQTKSQYDAYKSQYELAELQASYTEIRSPINGTVMMIHANQGSIAAPELPILTIGDLSNLVIKLSVPDKYYELFRTKRDMKIRAFRPGGEDKAVQADIRNISPVISPESRNFEVECSLSGDISALRPGMYVYCVFDTESRDEVFYLPYSALGPNKTLWYVDSATSTAEKLDFEMDFSNDEYFSIPTNAAGYDFIVEGQSFLTEGQLVKIK